MSGGLTKRTIWTIVVAVAVMVLLSGVLAYLQYWAPMRVTIHPENTTVDAGGILNLSVTVKKGLRSLYDSNGITYRWEAEPAALGSFFLRGERKVNFTAGNDACNGTITCRIEHKGETARDALKVTVKPAYLKEVSVTPSSVTFYVVKRCNITATSFDSVGREMPNASIEWSIGGSRDLELNTTAGRFTSITCHGGNGDATVVATATAGGFTASASVLVHFEPMPPRTVAYRWYDMFNVSFGEWWDYRQSRTHHPESMSDTYPYIFVDEYDGQYGASWGNSTAFSNTRLNITARSLTDVNMSERPVFLPFLGSARGGNANIDWYVQYLTYAECRWFPSYNELWDGWIISLNGTTTMDKQAAMAVLNITSSDFDAFATWWTANERDVEGAYSAWLLNEGKKRLDIYNMYEYPLTPLSFNLAAQKVTDEIVLTYDLVGWGIEALMTRWLHDAFMPTEWYFEDLDLHANIGSYFSDFDVESVVVGAVHATSSTVDNSSCWAWEGMLQDHMKPSIGHPKSDFAPYAEFNSALKPLPNEWPGIFSYKYTPGCFNLSAGESLVFEWPSGPQRFLTPSDHNAYNLSNYTSAPMTVSHNEPMPSDINNASWIDLQGSKVTFVGPIDLWTWSKLQTTYTYLQTWWEYVGLLPYGMPYIEFAMAT